MEDEGGSTQKSACDCSIPCFLPFLTKGQIRVPSMSMLEGSWGIEGGCGLVGLQYLSEDLDTIASLTCGIWSDLWSGEKVTKCE